MMTTANEGTIHAASEEFLLIRRAQNGDSDAASQLFERHRSTIYHYLLRRVRTRDDADDLIQETFVSASRSLVHYRGEGAFSAWLLSIAVHLLKNYYTRTLPKQARTAALEELDEEISTQVQRADRFACPYHQVDRQAYVASLLSALPLTCTDIESNVILLVYQGQSYEEISLLLNIGQDAARQHFLRGRGKLLAHLAEHDPEMLGGKERIVAAWQDACQASDVHAQPTREEQEAWREPRGRAKPFRKAVLKMARFLPISWLTLIALVVG
ncbi:MAG TPA: RNA polymerase sigma factor [Chthonomonadaceae bacterium]|nr:RNA polymerase sigma factor [Chthonomonadaceae bacterium]